MRGVGCFIPIGFGAMCGLVAEGRASEACQLSTPEHVTIATVEDGDTLVLTDGRTVRLIGALAPAPPLGWQDHKPWPMVREAKAALAGLAEGRDVELKFGGRREDRHGHLLRMRSFSMASSASGCRTH